MAKITLNTLFVPVCYFCKQSHMKPSFLRQTPPNYLYLTAGIQQKTHTQSWTQLARCNRNKSRIIHSPHEVEKRIYGMFMM